MSRQADPPFKILWRVFVEQFAANESATSDLQTRRAIIGVITFLIVPGLFLMMKTMPDYEMMLMVAKARNMPQLIEIRLAQLAVLFVSYSMSTTGLLTVFIWDALVFDKRDAMVLGPLPLRGSTIVSAKLAALATFLVGTALAVNITSGVPFGFVTGGPEGHILRHLAGHLSGTIGGAVFVFSTLVIVRGLLVLLVSAHAAATVGSFLQFLFLSGVLCFMMVPTAIGQVIPPISWFAALFELDSWIASGRCIGPLADRALIVLPLSVAGAIAVTFAGYWRQMRVALAPSARVAASARARRRFAALLTGRDRVAHATSDFVLTTLARSPVQQAPIAIAASLGVAIVSIALATRDGGFAELRVPRTVVLWIPIVLGYWVIVGLRASFVLPTELKAAWAFRVHSRLPSVIVLGRSTRRDGRVRHRTGTLRERTHRASAARLASRGHSRARRRCRHRHHRAVCVAAGGRRPVHARISSRTRATQDAMAPVPARHVGDCLRAGAVGIAGAERCVGDRDVACGRTRGDRDARDRRAAPRAQMDAASRARVRRLRSRGADLPQPRSRGRAQPSAGDINDDVPVNGSAPAIARPSLGRFGFAALAVRFDDLNCFLNRANCLERRR